MPRLRLTHSHYNSPEDSWERGDVREVSAERATYLQGTFPLWFAEVVDDRAPSAAVVPEPEADRKVAAPSHTSAMPSPIRRPKER